jgi:O-antigen/teichoic acid export membrane protein
MSNSFEAAPPIGLPVPEPSGRIQRPKRRNVFALGGAQLITWSVTLLWTFIVPRRLGASGWGMLVTGSSIAGIFGVLVGMGTVNYLVREFVRRPDEAPPLLGTSLMLRLSLLLPAAGVLAIYIELAGYGSRERLIIVIAAAVVCFMLLAEPFDALFQAVERLEFLAAGDVINTMGQSLLAIGLVLLGFGVVPVAASALGVACLVFILKWFWGRNFFRPQLRTTVRQARTMARESIPYWTMSLFLTFYLWVDSAMLSLMAPSKVVGWYGVPTRLFGTFTFAANMLSRLWLPRLIASFEQSENDFKHVARIPLEQALVLGIPIALGGAVVSDPLIRLLYGADFAGAIPAMGILALCLIPLYLNIMAYAVLVASGRQVVWTRIIIVASIANPLINLGAIRFFQGRYHNGSIGAALSLLVTELFITTVSLIVATRGIITRDSAERVLRSLVAGLVMAGIVYLAKPFGLIPRVLLGVVVYATMALLLKVPSEEDRQTARDIIKRRLGRGNSGAQMPPPVVAEVGTALPDPVDGEVGQPERGQLRSTAPESPPDP